MSTQYNGEFLNTASNWTSSNAFIFDTKVKSNIEFPKLSIEDAEVLSMWRLDMNDIRNSNVHEWRVLRNGQWMDSVYYTKGITEDEVRQGLIEHDGYPSDIIVVPGARK